MIPKTPIFQPHFILLALVFFCFVVIPSVSAATPSELCAAAGYSQTSSYWIEAGTFTSTKCPGMYSYHCDGTYPSDLGYGSYTLFAKRVREYCDVECGSNGCMRYPYNWNYVEPTSTPTPTPTPTPSPDCVTRCGYTWTSGKTADDYLLAGCVLVRPYDQCLICGWQMALMQEQFPCTSPPPEVPTYEPTPVPTMPPPPTALPTIPPRSGGTPTQIISIGDGKSKPAALGTIATIAPVGWNQTIARNNITSVIGNISDPYLNTVDGFGVMITLTYQHVMYVPNWVMAAVITNVQPIAVAYAEIIVTLADYANIPLQLMRLALDNTTFGIQGLLIYGVCLEFVIYLMRGET